MPDVLTVAATDESLKRALEQAARQPTLAADAKAISEALQHCERYHVIGVDTEFVRERTYHARPGLVQLSDGDRAWLLDPVALPRIPELGDLMSDERVEKVLHSVGEDLDVLFQVGGEWPSPVFDTQVAAAMLGMPLQTRYEDLIEGVFGVQLAGGKARSDWCRRPLSPDLLRYAAEDVVWLPRLRDHLRDALERAGRLGWLREDCARLVQRARSAQTAPLLGRVRGAGRLQGRDLARLDALVRWRERAARRADLPRRFVMADETLVELARARDAASLEQILGGLKRGHRKRHADSIRAALEQDVAEHFTRPNWLDPLSGEQKAILKQAQKEIRGLADKLGIEPALIASKKELTRLIRGERPDWVDGWRGELIEAPLARASVTIPAREAASPGSSAG